MKTSKGRRTVEDRYDCVFSARLKVLTDRSGDRSAGGRRFHVASPLTAKLTSLYGCSPGVWNQIDPLLVAKMIA